MRQVAGNADPHPGQHRPHHHSTQLLSEYAPNERLGARDWEDYLIRHSISLARLLARLPWLQVLSRRVTQRGVVYRAILLQPCPQLVSIVDGDYISGRTPGPPLRGDYAKS